MTKNKKLNKFMNELEQRLIKERLIITVDPNEDRHVALIDVNTGDVLSFCCEEYCSFMFDKPSDILQ